jgi:histidinol dehydrogenase
LAVETLAEIERQLKELTTERTARASWETKGEVIVVKNIEDAIKYANEYAPEHLEIHAKSPRSLLSRLMNYGSLFLGENTAEVYADKIAGPNHILPTGRAARYTGGLWVGMFMRINTYMETGIVASLKLAKYARTQADYEGMDAHKYAAAIRLKVLGRESN